MVLCMRVERKNHLPAVADNELRETIQATALVLHHSHIAPVERRRKTFGPSALHFCFLFDDAWAIS